MKQYKDFNSQIKDLDDKGRVLVAANAIGNIDSDNDISKEGSFDKTLREGFKRVKWLLNHGDILLGVPIEGNQSGKYLEMLGQLNMKKQVSRDIYEDYKLYAEHGKTLEHSIGVNAIKWSMKDDVREVTEWKLWEYSTLTRWGANEDTPMLGIKEAKTNEDALQMLDLMLRKGNYSDEKFNLIENKIKELKSLISEPVKPLIEEPKQRDWSVITKLY